MMCGASKKVYHCWLWRLWLIWAKFGLKYAFLGTQRPCQFIWCPVGWWLWCGAVTRKTPIYFILIILISWKIVVLVISVIIVIIIDYHWLSFVIIDYHWLSLIIIEYHWLSLIINHYLNFIDYHWLSLIIIDYLKIQKISITSLTDNLKSGDASASKKVYHCWLWRLWLIFAIYCVLYSVQWAGCRVKFGKINT